MEHGTILPLFSTKHDCKYFIHYSYTSFLYEGLLSIMVTKLLLNKSFFGDANKIILCSLLPEFQFKACIPIAAYSDM
jgi:hypothetical protein